MAATADKFERMMNLLAALLNAERPISAEQIQHRVAGYASEKEAFRRTFERDKDELRSLGVPIEVGPIPGTFPELEGYIVDRRTYELPELDLAPDEIAALHLALQAVSVGGPSVEDGTTAAALWRLGGVDDATPVLDDEHTAAIAAIAVDGRQSILFRAVLERCVCRFTYTTAGASAEREVEPWRVGYERGHWYLTGFDRDREATRNFRLDRMGAQIKIGEPNTFIGPAPEIPDTEYRPWDDGGSEQIRALVRFDPDQAQWALETLGPDTLREVEADGSHLFEVPVTAWEPFRSFLLGYLDHAELLEPPELRSDLMSWLQRYAEEDNR
jgi:proteasome accessory factor B